MKKILPLALLALALTSCDKEKDNVAEPLAIVHKQINGSFEYSSPLKVDLNDDGKDDFVFDNVLVSDSEGAHTMFYVRPLEHNQILLNMQQEVSIGNWAAALQTNDVVQENAAKHYQWVRTSGFVLDVIEEVHAYDGGPLADKNTVFVGIRLKEGEKYKAGWIKLSYTPNSSKVQVIEAAFHPSASQTLKAGQR